MVFVTIIGCVAPLPPSAQPVGVLVSDTIPQEGERVAEALLSGHVLSVDGFGAAPEGTIVVTRRLDGGADFSVALFDLSPEADHEVVFHSWPCVFGGGPAYEGPDGTVTLPLSSTEAGTAYGIGSVPTLRPDAVSAQVFTDGALQGCADLEPAQERRTDMGGDFVALGGSGVSGQVDIRREDSTTNVDLTVRGMIDAEVYVAAVHDRACAIDDGGAPYRINPAELDDEGISVELFPDAGTDGAEFDIVTHPIREDGQSVVVSLDGARVACADLPRFSYQELTMRGDMRNLEGGDALGLSLDGRTNLKRRLDGLTVYEIQITGMPTEGLFPVRVGDAPCDHDEGGRLYRIDGQTSPDGMAAPGDAVDLSVTTPPTFGVASRTLVFDHFARADAQSVVVFDPTITDRIGCLEVR